MSELLAGSDKGRPPMAAPFARLATHFAGMLALLQRPLAAAELIRVAQHRTGLTDFGDWAIEQPLAMLIESCETEARLNAFGRIAARWDALRFLTNLLRLREEEKRDPAILDETIVAPIFITGMPRSGTSFLHELLGEDPAQRAVRSWETIYPYPLKRGAAGDDERRRAKVERQLAAFARMTPEIRSLHPLGAAAPQECTEITGHVFQSMRFDTTHYVPAYRRWLEAQDPIVPYRFHKRFLQHLQHRRGPARWILKSPDHVFALDALRRVYPDARFVFMHRDPVAVLPSLARLTEVLRHPFTDHLDRVQIGTDLIRQWTRAAAIMVDAAASPSGLPVPPLHLAFPEFVRDPVAGAASVYRHFGLDLSAAAAARLHALVARKPQGGNGRNHGRPEDYAFDPAALRLRFASYTARFGLDA